MLYCCGPCALRRLPGRTIATAILDRIDQWVEEEGKDSEGESPERILWQIAKAEQEGEDTEGETYPSAVLGHSRWTVNANDLAADGFFLALHLVESFGVTYDRMALVKRLCEVAAGEISVFNSPEEELTSLERLRGHPATPEERQIFLRLFSNRANMDHSLRATATRVLEVIRQDQRLA